MSDLLFEGRHAMLVSGGLWPLSGDEVLMLAKYRAVRDDGEGFVSVEFAGGEPIRLKEQFGAGVKQLRALLPLRRLKD